MIDSTGKKKVLQSMRLYALVTEDYCRKEWQETVRLLMCGGVDVFQLREKNQPDNELLRRARWVRGLTREHGKLCIINDRPDIAVISGADGVHLGQDDLPVGDVRGYVGADLIVGCSTHSVEQAVVAEREGADYIGVGPVFATETKGYREGAGEGLVRDVVARVAVPVVAIGGIDPASAGNLMQAGAQAVAVCSRLCGAKNPEKAAAEFIRRMQEVDDVQGHAGRA
ncbi:MAG: thiamine phosphate synthase [Planctomycetota bacterium]